METDLDFYARCLVQAREAARCAPSAEARRCYERLARTFALQVHKAETNPTFVTPEPLRLRPLKLAA